MEHVSYNLRLKVFPDGSQRFYKSSNTYHRMSDEERESLSAFRKYAAEYEREHWAEYTGHIQRVDSLAEWYKNYLAVKNYDGHSVERGNKQNRKRSLQVVYDIARCNDFDWFVTFTFNPDKVNSFDYDDCCRVLALWLDVMRKRGVLWLVVPEQHESGRWHFHALVKGRLELVPAISPYTGACMYDESGNQIFNCGNFDWGFTTATEIRDRQRTASYLSKYIAKCLNVPKGKKRYWASRKLNRPAETFHMISDDDFGDFVDAADYFKDCTNQFGRFLIAEIDATKENA